MFRRIIWNDFRRTKTISCIMLLFLSAASALIALAVTLGMQLAGSMEKLMTQAKTPHFLQMHTGEIDIPRLESFAQNNKAVKEFQVQEFLNFDGSQISIGGDTLADSVQDHGLVTQNQAFDYLLDLEGEILQPMNGEIYLPVVYAKEAEVGEKITIADKIFTVGGFLRDSQMNSPLASSKRFLVSKYDYADIRIRGNIEYLIEFRLNSLSQLSAFEGEYHNAGLETNGPTVTYPLFRMMNAVSDGLMIAVLLLISALAVLIACMCIRFTLLAQMEEDAREIGIMKAMGLGISEIKKLYIGKYAFIAAAGSVLGWGLSGMLEKRALQNIYLAMGQGTFTGVWTGASVLLVFFTVLFYVNGVLNRFKKISAVQAMGFGSVSPKSTRITGMSLNRNRLLNTNLFLGFREVILGKRVYATMLCVVLTSTFLMLVPQNLYSTIASPAFSSYMGIGNADVMIRIPRTDGMEEKSSAIEDVLRKDENVAGYVLHTTKGFSVQLPTGVLKRIRVDLGDHTEFPVYYVKGNAPKSKEEIALSAMNAEEFGKQIGDSLVLVSESGKRSLTVCGIYSDITNGGKTAKANFSEYGVDPMWRTVYVTLKEKGATAVSLEEYSKTLPFAKITDIDGFVSQTFGDTIHSIRSISVVAIFSALLMTILITLLMIKLLIARERYTMAVMKAIGFTKKDIVTQLFSRFLLVLFLGVLSGTILSNTLGEALAGVVIASFGATAFKFVINPVFAYLLLPLTMGGAVLVAVFLGTSGVGGIQIFKNIKE